MRHLPGRLLAAAAVVPITVFASAAPAEAQEAPFAQPAQAAASWLVGQSDGTSWNGGDVSSSLDAVIALEAARVGGDQVQATLEWLNSTETLTPYVYPTVEGVTEPELNAGAAGKVMYTVATAGGDPANFGGIRLASEVTASQTANGTYGDGTAPSSAWAVLGLSRTDTPAGAEAAAGLAAVQCPDGGFNFGDVDGGDDCISDPDTTGLVASALVTLGEPGSGPLASAVAWLEGAQAEDGGFDNGFGENANSTAMAAQAFFAAGNAAAAESAVAFLVGLQFDCTAEQPGAVMYTDPEDPEFGEASRLLATAQAMVPLAGQDLANLDATDIEAAVPGNGCESADAGDDATGAADEEDEGSASWLPWVIGAAVVVLAALLIGLALKSRRGGAAPAEDATPAADRPKDGSGEATADDGTDK
ncbi:hypothetical protein O1R50_24495 [Glycomyces luteolus]|uniref:Terpene cyclase/mutase family protein n=1 Tax=Glycomyces luteolus TaxID=2670330 RepID=A0A9X3T6E5_9ACTN|nr:hypothetical protein [Glycomyces luteolus]MDA1362800.1 hypothetical protein [Glycomyces luteolus]